MYEIPDVIDTNVCLLPMITNLSTSMLSLYPHYENRILPFGGGLLDQPNPYTQAMQIIEHYINTNPKKP